MKLKKIIHPENILAQLQVSSKEELFEKQVDALIAALPEHYREGFTAASILQAVNGREALQSTSLGNGVAIPHARIPGFKHVGFCLAILREPLAMDAEDGLPVRISCMVVAAPENPNLVLKIWAAVMRILKSQDMQDRLASASTNEEALHMVEELDLQLEISVEARDIMVPPLFAVHPETPITEIVFKMLKHKEVATAVIDADGRLVGEITSDAIFKYGMPEFFSQLQSVSFVRHFNPLEKFFENESKMLARDIMTTDLSQLSPQATLIEIIFQLSVKGRSKVYVVDKDHCLCGVIGRLAVLDRAINF